METTDEKIVLYSDKETLKRGMKERHLAMIAIGGTIGSALFLGVGQVISQAGPVGAILAFVVGGLVMLLALLSLSEMAVAMPISGSFQAYATKFISPFAGFATGWLYWLNWGTSASAALIAAAIILSNWFPMVEQWIWCLLFGIILTFINMLSSRAYGEAEFWFAGIKVIAIIIFIIVGAAVLLGFNPQHAQIEGVRAIFKNGIFPNGGMAVFLTMIVVVCSFQGAELVGIAAGESENPEKTVPRAIKNVGIRIALFYILATIVTACILPYKAAGVSESPFASVFALVGIPYAYDVMSFVVVTSCLSSINSAFYACSRLLWSMANEGLAPRFLSKTNKAGVPFNGVLVTMALTMMALLVKALGAEQMFIMMLAASGLIGCLIWIIIAWCQLGFRKHYREQGGKVENLKFKTPLFPLIPVTGIVANIVIVLGMCFDSSQLIVFVSGGICIVLIALGYVIFVKKNRR